MKEKKTYIVVSSIAVVPISFLGFISAVVPSSPQEGVTASHSSTIEVKRSVLHRKQILSRPLPLDPTGTRVADIEPIDIEGVRYEEVLYPEGTVKATDLQTGTILWQTQVYSYPDDRDKATSAIPILFSAFMRSTSTTEDPLLKVINEKGDTFLLNVNTVTIQKISTSTP